MKEYEVICKKSLIHLGATYYIKDKLYKITIYDATDRSSILCELEKNVPFNLSKDNTDEYNFYNYFYTVKEYRKQKLKKINENV